MPTDDDTGSPSAHDVAFYSGPIAVLISDVGHALAVRDGKGEATKVDEYSAMFEQEARDLLDRAFRVARDRRDGSAKQCEKGRDRCRQ